MSPFLKNRVSPNSAHASTLSRSALRGAAAAASALLLGLVVGCGGSADSEPSSTTEATATESTTAAAADTASSAAALSTAATTSQDVPAAAAPSAGDAAASSATEAVIDAVGSDDADGRARIESATAAAIVIGKPATVTATGSGRTYVVGTPATAIAGATQVATMMAVPWSALPAGSVVLVAPGTYAGVTTITATGTAANPITVTAVDTTHPPVLTNSVDIQNSSYLTLSHVTVQQPTYNGFIIRMASHHVTVSDSTINKAPAGVAISAGAGIANQILRNTISDSVIDGIYLEQNSDATVRSLVQSNTISRSGTHGIEVRASYYQVEHNTVTASGQTSGGASGIHIYSGSASENSGDHNLVRYNLSYANADRVAADGNGIEVDQWCDGNTVAFNQAWNNDGAGIIVYDGSNNLVQNNTTWSNGVNSGGTHVGVAEIAITGTASATVKGNHVWNNLSYSTRASVPALYVDTRAVAGGNTIGANMVWNGAAGTLLRWTDSATKQTAALINAATGTTGNVVAAPAFTNAAAPATGGLSLKAIPALHGLLPTGLADFVGLLPATGDAFFGAYYKAP